MSDLMYDYVVIGGGLTGCALAGRLAERNPSWRILIIEAGANVAGHPLTGVPLACFGVHGSEFDWAYNTVPQTNLDERECYNCAGKAFGGSSAINSGTWTRGNAAEYDCWAEQVGDSGWSYKSWLPYFKRSETHFNLSADPAKHGWNGPIHNISVSASSSSRHYPLREPLRAAWERLGVKYTPDANSGSLTGLSELVENWRDGQRQPSNDAYCLSKHPNVIVITNLMARRILLEENNGNNVATGVEAVGGLHFMATREVILSAGAYRTPQVLMLSGIGEVEELDRHGIPLLVNAPEVGRNSHDHFAFKQWWKLREPEKPLSIVTLGAQREELERALQYDGEPKIKGHPSLKPDVAHLEILVIYAPAGATISKVDIPMDGTHIATAVLGMAPTSRGRITMATADPTAPPLIDPNYYASEVDRAALRAGIRQVAKLLLETPEGRNIVECETTLPGFAPLGPDSTNEEIDARVKPGGNTFYHAAGSAAMGKVVDTDLRVFGVKRLRVVDASILPVTMSCHYQALLYALAEKAADLISR